MYILLYGRLVAISMGSEVLQNMVFSGVYSSLFPDLPLTAFPPIMSMTGIISISTANL